MAVLVFWLILLVAAVGGMAYGSVQWKKTGSPLAVVGILVSMLSLLFFGGQFWQTVQDLWL